MAGGRKGKLAADWGQDRDFGEREGMERNRSVAGNRRKRRRRMGSWRREEQKRRFGEEDR